MLVEVLEVLPLLLELGLEGAEPGGVSCVWDGLVGSGVGCGIGEVLAYLAVSSWRM